MTIDYEKLFKPYTRDGHRLESTLQYLRKEAASKNVDPDCLSIAMHSVFKDIAAGKKFSMTKCHCGCGIDKAATSLIHTIRDRMFAIDRDAKKAAYKIIQDRFNSVAIKKNRLVDWSKSPIVNAFKRKKDGA